MCLLSVVTTLIIAAVFNFFGFWIGVFSAPVLFFINGYLTKYIDPKRYADFMESERQRKGD